MCPVLNRLYSPVSLSYTGNIISKVYPARLIDFLDEFYNVNLLYCNCQKMALKQDGVHFVHCPEQGNKIKGVVLNRVSILGILRPKQGQGFKPPAAHIYPSIGRLPPRGLGGCTEI